MSRWRDFPLLSAWLLFAIVGSLILLLLNFRSCSQFRELKLQYKNTSQQIQLLESQKPYPNEENLSAKKDMIEEYSEQVTRLHQELLSFQKPLTSPASTEFQQRLKSRIQELKAAALESDVKLPASFSLGLSRYTGTLPAGDATGPLHQQMEFLYHLAALLIESGVDSIESFSRSSLPVEGQADASESSSQSATDMVERSISEIVFRADQPALVSVLNALSNHNGESIPTSFFPVLRLVRVENESLEGPPREAQGEDLGAGDDARFLFGEEMLEVYMMVESLRFSPHSELSAKSETASTLPNEINQISQRR